jgi:hypothetical protein
VRPDRRRELREQLDTLSLTICQPMLSGVSRGHVTSTFYGKSPARGKLTREALAALASPDSTVRPLSDLDSGSQQKSVPRPTAW